MFLSSSSPLRTKKTQAIGIPVIDLSLDTITLSHHIIAACQDYGFFKLVNHGVSIQVISKMEEAVNGFFSKPSSEKVKVKANPPSPFGYGCRNIGFNGDVGELEYILLQANSLSTCSDNVSVVANQPTNFRYVINHKPHKDIVRSMIKTCDSFLFFVYFFSDLTSFIFVISEYFTNHKTCSSIDDKDMTHF
ncbi:putative gibberellin 2-beta-dioxygenase [Helianthus anomalus]